jgi:hypothetical protein
VRYRLANISDYPAIADYVHKLDYFMPVDPSTLGGLWLVAEQDGVIVGTMWFFVGLGNAYVDYWAGDTAFIAARLGALTQEVLAQMGAKHVRGMIGALNVRAQRLAMGLGMVSTQEQYALAYKRL